MTRLYPKRIIGFYVDGFRSMTTGRTLWKIIFVKLFIMFAILKLFFFPNYLNTHFTTFTPPVLAGLTVMSYVALMIPLVLGYIVYVWRLMDARKISAAEVTGAQADEMY